MKAPPSTSKVRAPPSTVCFGHNRVLVPSAWPAMTDLNNRGPTALMGCVLTHLDGESLSSLGLMQVTSK